MKLRSCTNLSKQLLLYRMRKYSNARKRSERTGYTFKHGIFGCRK